ncbi:MAG TPA: type II toxin-antitoxin system Phd/YefM family antitoxin [Tepidisphaeraceae bacterium]|jgi:PHD/YefM family antitoxin component YafN of YafNO toxin-antitoxin module|nr:type II toxin-antitoxin system Phd/YefM family antitoxin [Tepidisphaeraceae bacterium]
MLDLDHILPVTDFNRNTKEHIQWLKRTGQPEVLTVNGQAEIVVQSAKAYQKLVEAAELSETLAGIRRGLEEVKRGQGRPMREFLEKLAEKHGISLK